MSASPVRLRNVPLEEVDAFTYLGSVVHNPGGRGGGRKQEPPGQSQDRQSKISRLAVEGHRELQRTDTTNQDRDL